MGTLRGASLRPTGPAHYGALTKAGKQAVCVEADGVPVKGAQTARALADTGPVDGAVLLPPAPWDARSAEFTAAAVRQCGEQGIARVWIYTVGDPTVAVEIATEQGLDPCAGRRPCLHIVGGGFPHGTHRSA